MSTQRKTASGWQARAVSATNAHNDVTEACSSTQYSDGRKTAGRYAGSMLRECRSISAGILTAGVGPHLLPLITRLRNALSSIEWLLDYNAEEGRQ